MRSGRFAVLGLVFLMVFSVAGVAQAASTQVPDAAAYVLAPAGFATLVAVQSRRRRMERIRRGVGIGYRVAKRSLDVLLGAAALLIVAPLFFIIAVAVRLDGPGPILFRREVLGKNGKLFGMLKFRTMVVGAERILRENEDLKRRYYRNCKLKNDPRVTRVGRLLRRTSLDELPQLINVVLGDMTFVGPRPIAPDEAEVYGPAVERFKTVKPGITGLWQTSGRSETSYSRRVELDMLYIDRRSILMDFRIIALTLPAVLLKRGAC